MRQVAEFMQRRPAGAAALAVAAVVALRLVANAFAAVELGADEAQYWRWAQTLDWGYYSKPPLIAWAIAVSTALFGDGEWAVRAAAPVAHGLGALALFALARRMYDLAAGWIALGLYLLMPGVWLSSLIMSTDALLLPLWSAALLALWTLREGGGHRSALAFGAALGAAVLAKYAALYLLAGAALACIVDPATRRALISPRGATAFAAAALIVAPNLAWNALNDFATVSHTSDNANWTAARLDLGNIPQFFGDQAAVFGPVGFLMLLAALVALARRRSAAPGGALWLACFILPPLLVILGQAVVARAHANWAASAYPAACVLLAGWANRPGWRPAAYAALALNTIVGAVFILGVLAPAVADRLGGAGAFTRVRGWEATADALAARARELQASALVFDDRELWHAIDYHGRGADLPPHRVWRVETEARSYAETVATLAAGEDGRALIVSEHAAMRALMRGDFASMEPAGQLSIPLGPGRERRLDLFLASGYRPVPRTGSGGGG